MTTRVDIGVAIGSTYRALQDVRGVKCRPRMINVFDGTLLHNLNSFLAGGKTNDNKPVNVSQM